MIVTIPKFEKTKGGWIEYIIHVDGNFKVNARYRQLEKLYRDCVKSCRIIVRNDPTSSDNLRRQSSKIPPFPPKKLFNLNFDETEIRRKKLELWLNALSQLPHTHPAYQQLLLFLNIPKKIKEFNEIIDVKLYLLDETYFQVSFKSNHSNILSAACLTLNLPESYSQYFSLYISSKEKSIWQLQRKLYPLESNYSSLKIILEKCKSISRICFAK